MYSLKLDDSASVYLALVKDVKDLKTVKSKVLSGQLQCSLLKPSLIVDPLQILSSAYKSYVSSINNDLATKSVYSEILFNLSPSKNITQSLKKFGVDNDDLNVVFVVIGQEDSAKGILEEIKGETIDISRLSEFTDTEEVTKVYGITETVLKVSSLTDAVVTKIATKQCII